MLTRNTGSCSDIISERHKGAVTLCLSWICPCRYLAHIHNNLIREECSIGMRGNKLHHELCSDIRTTGKPVINPTYQCYINHLSCVSQIFSSHQVPFLQLSDSSPSIHRKSLISYTWLLCKSSIDSCGFMLWVLNWPLDYMPWKCQLVKAKRIFLKKK